MFEKDIKDIFHKLNPPEDFTNNVLSKIDAYKSEAKTTPSLISRMTWIIILSISFTLVLISFLIEKESSISFDFFNLSIDFTKPVQFLSKNKLYFLALNLILFISFIFSILNQRQRLRN